MSLPGPGMVTPWALPGSETTPRVVAAPEAQLLLADWPASLGTLVNGLAHEINNPLACICANLDFLARELERLDSSAGGERLSSLGEVIRETRVGAERIAGIVRDLRAFAGGVRDDRLEPVDVRPVVEFACRMAEGAIRSHARLVIVAEPAPPVHGNGLRLGQVFLTLLSNAARSLPAGRPADHELRVTIRRGVSNRVVVEVREAGAGWMTELLPPSLAPCSASKPPAAGVGLGLAICQVILAAMGGALEVEGGGPGEGGAFRVVLPVAGAPGGGA